MEILSLSIGNEAHQLSTKFFNHLYELNKEDDLLMKNIFQINKRNGLESEWMPRQLLFASKNEMGRLSLETGRIGQSFHELYHSDQEALQQQSHLWEETNIKIYDQSFNNQSEETLSPEYWSNQSKFTFSPSLFVTYPNQYKNQFEFGREWMKDNLDDLLENQIRIAMEDCDYCQGSIWRLETSGFHMGLSSLLLEAYRDEYPKKKILVETVHKGDLSKEMAYGLDFILKCADQWIPLDQQFSPFVSLLYLPLSLKNHEMLELGHYISPLPCLKLEAHFDISKVPAHVSNGLLSISSEQNTPQYKTNYHFDFNLLTKLALTDHQLKDKEQFWLGLNEDVTYNNEWIQKALDFLPVHAKTDEEREVYQSLSEQLWEE